MTKRRKKDGRLMIWKKKRNKRGLLHLAGRNRLLLGVLCFHIWEKIRIAITAACFASLASSSLLIVDVQSGKGPGFPGQILWGILIWLGKMIFLVIFKWKNGSCKTNINLKKYGFFCILLFRKVRLWIQLQKMENN